MYSVINQTSKNMFLGETILLPGRELIVSHHFIPTKVCKFDNIGSCKITSSNGEHSTHCTGKITCTPQIGRDKTVFVLREKEENL